MNLAGASLIVGFALSACAVVDGPECPTLGGACRPGVEATGLVDGELTGATVRACRRSDCVVSSLRDCDGHQSLWCTGALENGRRRLVIFLAVPAQRVADGETYSFTVTAADGRTTLAEAREAVAFTRSNSNECGDCIEAARVELRPP